MSALREKPVNANSMSKLLIASNGVSKIVVNIFSFFRLYLDSQRQLSGSIYYIQFRKKSSVVFQSSFFGKTNIAQRS